jgi:type VI secretion system protein ImpL
MIGSQRFNGLRKSLAMSLAGVLALSFVFWYEGPLLAFDGHVPLESPASRWTLIAMMFAAWAIYWGAHWVKPRLASSNFVRRLVGDASAGGSEASEASEARKATDDDLAILRTRFEEALKTLRTAGTANGRKRWWQELGRPSIYDLPWYMFVGAPGSGKTTALVHSGLRFPLADRLGARAQSVGGVGGTRNCEWWFADDAVLLDTAGRFTTQDSHAQADRGAWLGFLRLLRKFRARRPLNGVLVVVSAADLLQQDGAAREAHAASVRGRLKELDTELGMQFPVYVVITKSDLLSGFTEFFDDLGRDEREQVWGITFPYTGDTALGDTGAGALERFPEEFGLLHRQLQDRVLHRMQQETDPRRRSFIYAFPQQFAGIEGPLGGFLRDVFGQSRFDQPALLRGVYFTSGTQSGRPFDRMMSSMAAALGLRREVLLQDSASGRAYFVKRLLSEVIFAEAGLAGSNVRVERRRARFQRVAVGMVAVLLVVGLVGLFVSNRANREFVQASSQQIAALQKMAQQGADTGDPVALLPLLDAARDLPGGEAGQRAHRTPWWAKLGLNQREKLGGEARRVYRRLLQQTLLPIVLQRMEDDLRRGDSNDPGAEYDVLRAYLMLGDPVHFDPAVVQSWAMRDWQTGALSRASDLQRNELDQHLAVLFLHGEFDANLPLDQKLIAQARATLDSVPLAQRMSAHIRQGLLDMHLPDFTIAQAAGPDGVLVFVRKSGEPLTRGVPGIYSVAGYRNFVQLREVALANAGKGDWVLGHGDSTPGAASSGDLRNALTQLYCEQYIREWDALLADIGVVPFSTPDQGARIANLMASGHSPLRTLVVAAARETTLTPATPAVSSTDPGKLDALRKRIDGVFGVAPGTPPVAEPTMVDAHFQALHDFVGKPGATSGTPLDETVAALGDAAATLQAVDSASKQSLPPPQTSSLDKLKLLAQDGPPPVTSVLDGVAGNADSLRVSGERARLDALWTANVAPLCREAIDGRYPLVAASSRDAAPDDFARVLEPGGTIDDFFAKNLQNSIDTSGPTWRWRPQARSLGVPDDVPVEFQRAAQIRDALFRDGGHDVAVRFSVKLLKLDPAVKRFVLDVDGQQFVASSGATAQPAPFQWLGGKAAGQAHVDIDPAPPAGNPALHADGPWALLHLLDAAQVREAGQPDRFTVAFDAGKVELEFDANSVANPFQPGLLSRFRCPDNL